MKRLILISFLSSVFFISLNAQTRPVPPPPARPPSPPLKIKLKEPDQVSRLSCCKAGKDQFAIERCTKKKLYEYIYENLQYPEVEKKKGNEAVIMARIYVHSEGHIFHTKLVKKSAHAFNDEAMRLLEQLSDIPEDWIPGKKNDQAINTGIDLYIRFKLNEENALVKSMGTYSSIEKAESDPENVYILNLEGKQMDVVSEAITKFSNLEELSLKKNYLKEIPPFIGELKNLEKLDISWNKLENLPESFRQLQKLEHLDMKYNKFTSLPAPIYALSNLTKLQAIRNEIVSISDSIERLSNLESLVLNNNKLITLPETIGNLSKLTSIALASNQLKSLPASITNCTSLEHLELGYNTELIALPESIGSLSNLKELYLAGLPKLEKLPKSIDKLLKLERLFFTGSGLNKEISDEQIKRFKEINPDCSVKW